MKEFFLNNWKGLLAIIIILIIIYRPTKTYVLLKYSRHALEKCKVEKETISELQKELQTQYYVEHSIDKKTYHDDFSNFEERKTELQNRIDFHEEKSKTYKSYFDRMNKRLNMNGTSRS